MAAESTTPPPPPGGGSAKYIVILLILLMGAGGVWFAMGNKEPEQAAAPPPPPPAVERETSLTDDSLVIPEEEELVEEETVEEETVEEETPDKPKRTRPAGDPWACSGDLPPAEIRKVISSSASAIRSCYERRLKNVNMLQGTLNLQVKVGVKGDVAATRVRGTLRDETVRSCVQGQARQWKFPAPSGGCVVFDAPYNFTPKI